MKLYLLLDLLMVDIVFLEISSDNITLGGYQHPRAVLLAEPKSSFETAAIAILNFARTMLVALRELARIHRLLQVGCK